MMNIPHEEDLICVYPTTETQTKIIGLINSVGNLLIVCSGCAFFFFIWYLVQSPSSKTISRISGWTDTIPSQIWRQVDYSQLYSVFDASSSYCYTDICKAIVHKFILVWSCCLFLQLIISSSPFLWMSTDCEELDSEIENKKKKFFIQAELH